MRRNHILFFLILAGVFFLITNNYALQDEFDEVLKLYIGEPLVVPVNNPSRIIIGNPDIVDVANALKNEITLVPKAVGTTSLTLWDNFGEQFYKVKVFTEDVFVIKQRVDNLLAKLNLPEVWTKAEEEEGRVFLLGNIKNSQDRERIATALGPLKEKTVDLIVVKEEETAVDIAVEVLELSKDAESTLGFTNPLSAGTVNITEVGSKGIATTGEYWTKLFRVLNVRREAFAWSLSALVKEGKAKILSRPRLACQSGKEAELLVGGEKPIFSTEVASAGGEGTNVEYKEYGLKLKIKPTVSQDRRIKVALTVDISEVQSAEPETIGTAANPTASAYPLTKRTVSTELYLDDGQTLAIGGLIKQKKEEDVAKTAGLGDIPILGALFRKKVTKTGGGTGERGDVELFITLTPTIVGGGVNNGQTQGSAPTTQRSVPTGSDSINSVNEYSRVIQQRILENMTYPASAKDAGYSGTVQLSLLISQDGRLEDVIVRGSSGHKILDDNAVTVTEKLVSYPPLPPSTAQKEIWVDVPIVYSLD